MNEPLPIRSTLAAPGVSLVLVALVSLILVTTSAAAPGAKLSKGQVSPASGTATTVFRFSVDFQGSGETAVAVTAAVANGTLPLARTSGSSSRGSWSGSSKLPVGSWRVTFRAVSSGATNPTLAGPIVVVAGAPRPTPTPTPKAGPTATPRPTPAPGGPPATSVAAASLTLEPMPTPFGVAVADPSNPSGGAGVAGAGSGGPTASAADGAATGRKQPFKVPVEGVVAIGLLGAVAVVAASAERRRRQASEDQAATDASESAEPPLDEDTIGVIEYAQPSEGPDAQEADAEGGRDVV